MSKQAKTVFPEVSGKLGQYIGPSLVTLGLGIGSGEFVLWPYLVVQYGFGIIWLALLGIAFQSFLLLEISRYTVVSGESIVHGFRKLSRFLPFWLILSTLIGFGWPGFATTASHLFVSLVGLPATYKIPLAIIFLIFCGSILLLGSETYKRIESLQKLIMPLSFIFLVGLFVYYFDLSLFKELLLGFIGQGNGYVGIPAGIDIAILLGAFAYAGSGGNFLLGQSFYSIERKLGNAKYADRLDLSHDEFDENKKEIKRITDISESPESMKNFTKLRFFQNTETWGVFFFFGLATIVMLSYLAFAILQNSPAVPKNFDFLLLEAQGISQRLGIIPMIGFVFIGIFALLSVQLGALDIMGRLAAWSVHAMRKDTGKHRWHVSQIYKGAVLLQLVAGIIVLLLGVTEPQMLVVVGGVFNALAMAVIAFVVLRLTSVYLPDKYRSGGVTRIVVLVAGVSYIGLFLLTLLKTILG